jgi:hypothetical protein
MNQIFGILILMASQSFAFYIEGDTISIDHQNMEFSYCYPSDSDSTDIFGLVDSIDTFSLYKNKNKIILIEMSATW